jgi:hypothetical protein
VGNPALVGVTGYGDGGSGSGNVDGLGAFASLNMNDMSSAVVTLFCLLVVNNWFVVVDAFAATAYYHHGILGTTVARLFFLAYFIVAVVVVLNLVISWVVRQFDDQFRIDKLQANLKRLLMEKESPTLRSTTTGPGDAGAIGEGSSRELAAAMQVSRRDLLQEYRRSIERDMASGGRLLDLV